MSFATPVPVFLGVVSRGAVTLLLLVWFGGSVTAQSLDAASVDIDKLKALEWREVGPYRGGRCAAVTGVSGHDNLFYFGAAGGGVWKTTNGGRSWENVSDGTFGGSIGAVAVSEWDENVVYVGEGEKTVRGNVSQGNGIWKSTDAGRSWKHVGLDDSRHICRIRIHPRDPETVYAAALGHLFGPNEERGVFRSRDGGTTWKKILYVNENAGAVDLAMDPTNPRILYATFWRIRRTPYSLESGGEGSGIWKSTDGGDTWTDISTNEGLPKGNLGIIGITVSPSNPDSVYAIVEAEEGGVFRSTDAGKKWKRVNEDRSLRQRAWYYSRIYADPKDEESVYVLNVRFHRSKDGGKSFSPVSTPHGDNHDLWIDPDNPLRMIEGNDGGANVSYDGGATWTRQDNQPTAQMYRVSVDDDFPYRLLGGQQDNSALRIRSRSLIAGGIGVRDWDPTAGGESGHIVAKPGSPNIVYGGSYGGYLTRVDHETGQRQAVNVWPDNPMGWGAAELQYRFQWNFPIFFSPHDPDRLFAAANVLFRSDDGGASWEKISPDLTRNDKSKLGSSGGPITQDNTSVEYYCTIFAALESPHEPGILWCGSDDGLLHISRDNGESWNDVTPPDLPEWTQINSIEAHPTEKGGLYVAGTRYKLDDFRPYLYKTTDYGKSWTKIVDGIDEAHFTRVIRADPDRPGLLFAGTERGVYVSFDDGVSFRTIQLNLPIVPITDLAVKEKDLVVATQGRGYWILDDLTPLHQLGLEVFASKAYLFKPRETRRVAGRRAEKPKGVGTNSHFGVVIHYSLGQVIDKETEFKLEIQESNGTVIRTFVRKPDSSDSKKETDEARTEEKENLKKLTTDVGLNRFVWDLRYPGTEKFEGLVLWNRRLDGPKAICGNYRAHLVVGEWSETVDFEIVPDPRSKTALEEHAAQFDFAIEVRDKLTEVHWGIRGIRETRAQLIALKKRCEGTAMAEDLKTAVASIEEKMKAIEEALYQTKNQSRQDPLNFPIRLNDKLAGLLSVVGYGDTAPTQQAHEVKDQLVRQIDSQLVELQAIWDEDLPALNEMAYAASIEAVVGPDTDDGGKGGAVQ